jgi:hypothetical protein
MGLKDLLPERVRRVLYVVYAFVGLGIGATFAGYAAVPDAQVPTVLVVVLAVYSFLGAPLGFTAAANTPGTERRFDQPNAGE